MKILTLNINGYATKHGEWDARLPLIASAIRIASPDIVALQAVRCDPGIAGGKDQSRQVFEQLEGYGTVWYEAATHFPGGITEGSALIGRESFGEKETLLLPADPACEDSNVRIVMKATVGNVRIFNCHFSWADRQNEGNLERARTYFRSLTRPSIVVGDFNATPDKPSIRELRAEGWEDAWTLSSPGDDGFTFEADDPRMRIDYCFVGRDIARRVRETGIVSAGSGSDSARLSDHLGLLVTIDV